MTKIRVAYSQVSAVQTPVYAASDLGIYQQFGLDASVELIAGTQQVPAMLAGELQFGTPGGNELVDGNLAGASSVMIATSSNFPLFSMYADKSITDVSQLAGKNVAITTAGSSTDAAAKVFLQHFNVLGQAKILPAGSVPAALAVLEKNQASAAIISPPTTAAAAKEGYVELVNGPKLGVPLVHAGVTVTRDYLKAHSDTVKAFLQAYYKAWTFCADPANEPTVEKTIAKWTKSDDAAAQASYKYV
ncbi:MAG: ABC transporter substrate-binding protein, partial [Chloroflexi bacterium]|nr:ABC transporter substrate-binding protein [Chloroflexota bacterium]